LQYYIDLTVVILVLLSPFIAALLMGLGKARGIAGLYLPFLIASVAPFYMYWFYLQFA